MSTRDLTNGQTGVLATAAVVMVGVGAFGAWGTYSNAVTEFHRQATAAGVVAAGEGLTLILALILLGRTMLGQSSPTVVRGGLWVAPVSASGIGLSIANDAREAAVYAVTPLAMSGAAEGLGFIARSIVVYRTGRDAEADRRNAATVQQLAYQQALANGHPDAEKQKNAKKKAWKLIGRVGVGDPQLAEGLIEVQRVRLREGADAALAIMYGTTPVETVSPTVPMRPQTASATEVLRARFANMDPADAIRFAHDARPDAPPAELAAILGTYEVHVDPVAVALVLGQEPPRYEVHRPDAADARQVSALEPLDLQGAIEEAASALGPEAKAREIADRLREQRRLVVTEPYIRTALSRAAKKPQGQPEADEMRGGYA